MCNPIVKQLVNHFLNISSSITFHIYRHGYVQVRREANHSALITARKKTNFNNDIILHIFFQSNSCKRSSRTILHSFRSVHFHPAREQNLGAKIYNQSWLQSSKVQTSRTCFADRSCITQLKGTAILTKQVINSYFSIFLQ